jgi:hypothetical protein
MMRHALSPADQDLRSAFESAALPPAAFDHRAHVLLAYAYLAEHEVERAVQRMRDALLHYLRHHGVPVAKYHETLTRAWILAVRHFMDRGGSPSGAEFLARHPVLLDSKIMLTHYSAALLFSDQARARFVEPDLDPIPAAGAAVGPDR